MIANSYFKLPTCICAQERNPKFAEVVEQSRLFYCLTLTPGYESDSTNESPSPLTTFLQDGIEQGKFPGSVMAMHRYFYWHRMLLEDMGPGKPCVEIALQQLRAHFYRMIIDRGPYTVTEYGRTPYEELARIQASFISYRFIP